MSMSITPASQPEISFCSLSLSATPIMLVTLFLSVRHVHCPLLMMRGDKEHE